MHPIEQPSPTGFALHAPPSALSSLAALRRRLRRAARHRRGCAAARRRLLGRMRRPFDARPAPRNRRFRAVREGPVAENAGEPRERHQKLFRDNGCRRRAGRLARAGREGRRHDHRVAGRAAKARHHDSPAPVVDERHRRRAHRHAAHLRGIARRTSALRPGDALSVRPRAVSDFRRAADAQAREEHRREPGAVPRTARAETDRL